MLLKYLELSGFKSFPDRTRVEFGKGLTAVVGKEQYQRCGAMGLRRTIL